MDERYKRLIRREFIDCTTATLARTIASLEQGDTGGNHKPFHTALLTPEAILWSKFERSFVTSFGQRVMEEVALLVAKACGATGAERQKSTDLDIDKNFLSAIEAHIGDIRSNTIRGNWERDLAGVTSVNPSGETEAVRVISDLWFKKAGKDNYISLKTVKPNIDQTAEAKRDMLKIKACDPDANVYYGLYYNPYGESRSDYRHTPPMKVFDFHHDSVVIIGKEFWDTVGEIGVYEEVLAIAEDASEESIEIVKKYSEKISL